MRTPEPDLAPKPATADGHALGMCVLGEICEAQLASGANAAEVLQLRARVEHDKASAANKCSRDHAHTLHGHCCATRSATMEATGPRSLKADRQSLAECQQSCLQRWSRPLDEGSHETTRRASRNPHYTFKSHGLRPGLLAAAHTFF